MFLCLPPVLRDGIVFSSVCLCVCLFVCPSVFQHNNSITVIDIITKFSWHHPVFDRKGIILSYHINHHTNNLSNWVEILWFVDNVLWSVLFWTLRTRTRALKHVPSMQNNNLLKYTVRRVRQFRLCREFQLLQLRMLSRPTPSWLCLNAVMNTAGPHPFRPGQSPSTPPLITLLQLQWERRRSPPSLELVVWASLPETRKFS